MIIEIVPNGTMVKKGDVLCRLDASEYQDVADAQQFRVLQHQAEAVQTDLALRSALIALREYSEGLRPQEILGMQGRIALAESDVKAASDRLDWSHRMIAKGYASLKQVAGDRQALLSAKLRLEQAQLELDTYQRFNSPKQLVALKAQVEKARKWAIHEAGDFDKAKVLLANYLKLVDRCTIRAPHDGFVIYANGSFRPEDERVVIEPGASVYQGQELFYFPDLSKMEVLAMLCESAVGRVRAGMPTRIRFEGSPEETWEGRVESVESLPRRARNDVPYYPCRVALTAAPPELLPSKSAEVDFELEPSREVLAIPTEAVTVQYGRHVCYVVSPTGPELREITLGETTSNLIEVTAGLKETEQIVLNASQLLERPDSSAEPATTSDSDAAPIASLK
jgi:HlyD family secretion protein